MKKFVNDNRRIILIIVILIVISILVLIIFNKNKKLKDEDVEDYMVVDQEEYINEWKGKLNNITDFSEYFLIKNALNKFYSNYAQMYGEDNDDDYFSNIVYKLLPESYIKEKNITIENIKEKFNKIDENEVYILEAYSISDFEEQKVYIAKYLVRETSTSNILKHSSIIVCNTKNQIFDIYPNDYVESLNLPELEIGKNIELKIDENVISNSENQYRSQSKTKEDYAKDVFERCRKIILFSPEEAYYYLNEEQKEEYPTYEKFKQFIEENRKDIFLMTYGSFELKQINEKNYYVIYDKNDKFSVTIDTSSLINAYFKIQKI